MERFQYFAFISYSRKDEYWAKWLHKKLETYKLPSIIRKEYEGQLPDKIHPVFLDKTDIGLGSLKTNLKKELEDSRYLIVICSPNAAKSEWVNTEVEHFKTLDRGDRIIPFIIEGTPQPISTKEKQCYPPALEKTILGASLEELPKEQALIKLIANLLGLKFDKLWNREKRRKTNLIIRNCGILITILSVISYLTIKTIISNKEKKEAEEKSVIAKSNDLIYNAEQLVLSNPNNAFLLFASAYDLHQDSTTFNKLKKFYEKNTKAYLNVDSLQGFVGIVNLFTKTISSNFDYEIEDSLTYDTDDLVQYSLNKNTIITLNHNIIRIQNFHLSQLDELNLGLSKLNVLYWKYNSIANCIVFHCEDLKNEREDIYIYDIGKKKLYNLYHNSIFQNDEILGYYFDKSMQKSIDKDSLFSTQNKFEYGIKIYIPEKTSYAIIYASHYMFGSALKETRRFSVINLKDYDYGGVLNLVVPEGINGSYQFTKVLSSSPDGNVLIVKYSSSYSAMKDTKIIGYNLANNSQRILHRFDSDSNEPLTVSWISDSVNLCYLQGSYNGSIKFQLFNKQSEGVLESDFSFGAIRAITYNEKYIIGSTTNGYIIVWKNNFRNWISKEGRRDEYHIASFKGSNNSITNLQINNDTLTFKDDMNSIKLSKLNEYYELSRNPKVLKFQIEKMNIEKLNRQDSINYGLIKK